VGDKSGAPLFYEDPAHLSADERLDELAALLAAGTVLLSLPN
jgi:hypothetical protein